MHVLSPAIRVAARLAYRVSVLALLAALVGCPTSTELYCEELLAKASDEEPTVTARLMRIAEDAGGELIKLEFRLKGRDSMLRKVNKALHEHPDYGLADVRIDDALRYTMRVEDEPAGNYIDTARATLKRFEVDGHTVVLVKNYWPADDSYSGLNCVLMSPKGLHWELQFHTRGSLAANVDNRKSYEELRLVTTSAERKRELFDQMTRRWRDVSIPTTALEPGALHPSAKIITRPRP
jgi:hypothetical protein